MEYIDSILTIDNSEGITYKDKTEVVHLVKRMIASCLEYLDSLISWKKINLQKINLLSNVKTPIELEYVDFLKEENILFDINCQFMLYYADILIAYKNMHTTDDDWEARVYIRRIYTLLYEILDNFYGQTGKPIEYLNKYENTEAVRKYKCVRKNLRRFLNIYKLKFKDIRNITEAHKDAKISQQINLITHISIKESFLIIENANIRINDVISSMPALFQEFNSRLSSMQESISLT